MIDSAISDPRQARLAFGLLLLLIVTLSFVYIVYPRIKEYQGTKKVRSNLVLVVEDGRELPGQLAEMTAEVNSLGKTLHGDMAHLSMEKMEAYIIERLQKISWRNEVELAGIKPKAGNTVHVFREILFDIEIRGDYMNLVRWLQELNSEIGFIVINRFQFLPVRYVDQVPILSLKLTIVSYKAI
ncbi:MAG: type 4a pilus biogenesis protein PilO [Gammaproteobacteria bacterium]|nr:type 4a pilus biogenesis protein PilO [Gammaproteobacteria bacterium]